MHSKFEWKTDGSMLSILLEKISKLGIIELEKSCPDRLAYLFRTYGSPRLLVSEDYGGKGAGLLDALNVIREVAAYSPSLSIMMVMHHHTIYGFNLYRGNPFSNNLLEKVSTERALVSSAFSEFRGGHDILDSSVQCFNVGDKYQVDGSKQPCTMASLSDFIVVGVMLKSAEQPEGRGIAVVDRNLTGVSSAEFWPCDLLSGADNNKIMFEKVVVDAGNVILPTIACKNGAKIVSNIESTLACAFQILANASYLGMLSALVRAVARSNSELDKLDYLCVIESCSMLLEYLVTSFDQKIVTVENLVDCSIVTHQVRRVITECVNTISSHVSGASYLKSEEIRYLIQIIRCVNFHPPSVIDRQKIINAKFDL